MRKTNSLDLDGHVLRTFLAILENSSVTAAADALGVTQSAVSHTLAKLRMILGDPLFVRSGMRLTPTEIALSLKKPVQEVLDGLNALTDQRPFDPHLENMRFVIAANDMQRDLVFPQLLRELWLEESPVDFEFIPSGHPSVAMMRDSKCDMAITPVPPDAADIIQAPLFAGKMMCYYDADMRDPPGTWEEFRDAEHIRVKFAEGHTSLDVLKSVDRTEIRNPRVCVPNFNAIPPFLTRTRLIATELDLMQLETLKDLDMAPLPFGSETVAVYMIWHERSTNDPAHKWLRSRVQNIASQIPERMEQRRNNIVS
jgi:DNA-binding transcriptional LysR family regulator